ncbi:serine/threonine-protein kinase SMG1 isoform X1 [Microplitis mediator]|uniref:serine/threonine-protein kinase SMG1 isoform X1 n=1 Tax=Microplitis mediator TaxID=375433 RepID=UPI0025563ED5|nr:serine/threonine-protein kinase SMG1 isoform X1 [Microplitis mediator]XP_057324227.1 serine/threonine-protein kinase SMG1 isoform X1 [Microplitis mediator]
MNSCENSNASTKLQGSKSSELWEESTSNSSSSIKTVGDTDKFDKKNQKSTKGESDTTNVNDSGVPRGTLVICPRNSGGFLGDHCFSRIKQRTGSGSNTRNEFRMARGNNSGERVRPGQRGRPFKKNQNDRDSNTEGGGGGYHSTSRQKFQESLKNHDNSQNKYYDDKRLNDESRVTKLLRRLCRESDDHFLPLAKQVLENFMILENHRYIRGKLEPICEYLLDALRLSPDTESQRQIIKCFAYIGFIADREFKRYLEWIFGKCTSERKDDIKCLLLKSLGETLKMDTGMEKLNDFAVTIISRLQATLENVEKPDLLMATVDVILIVIESCPEVFSNYFRDTVDILVGWHIDFTQSKKVIAYASRSLRKLETFWISDMQFTLTLLSQFLEDMQSYDEELTLPGSGRSSPGDEPIPGPKECILRITSLISVFNTVVKSVSDNLNPSINPAVQWSFLTECLLKMLRTVMKAIEVDENRDDNNDVQDENSSDNVDNLVDYVKDLKLSQKNIDTLIRNVNQDGVNNQQNLIKVIKSLNYGRRKNSFDSIVNSTLDKDKEQLLIKLIKSLGLKKGNNKNEDASREKEELIIVANECAYHLLGFLQTRITKNHDLLYEFIDLQLSKINIFLDDTIISTLHIIAKVIREVSANLPLEIVHKLLGSDSVLLKLRLRNSIAMQDASLSVYHSLLGLKNIPLLQEAYRYILGDLEIAYKLIIKNLKGFVTNNPLSDMNYKASDAEIIIIFILRALSDLANASNSIIGMWALKPSILELLAVKMCPYDMDLSKNNPLLQYSILYLLYAHCSRYNHFVPSSSLISGSTHCRSIDIFPGAIDVPTASPTSGHLSTILNLIVKCFEINTPEKTFLLLSTWIQEIFIQAEKYLSILNQTDECKMIVSSLLSCGATTHNKISMSICDNLEILISDKKVVWPESIYIKIVDLSILHLTSYDKTLRSKYGNLLMHVPINIVIPRINRQCLQSETKKQRTIDNYSTESLIIAQRLHMRGHHNETHSSTASNSQNNGYGEMQSQHFKTYMAFLLQDYNFDALGLSEIFTLCWPVISRNKTTAKMYEFGMTNQSFLFFWSGIEAAQHCVLNKLRTALGKPQETFTTIEGALKTLARDISCKPEVSKNDKHGLDYSLHEHTRVRLFVEFLEHLERMIHNAAEGCAVSLSPLPKPVRTFFHTNKSTCREWLNRIRLALCVVSLHAGLATNALRNGQRLLEDLSDTEMIQGPEFERATLCTAQALVMLGEAEALQGLYIYTKERDRKFLWLKAAMEEASGRYESAAESYKIILKEHPSTKFEDLELEVNTESVKVDGDTQVAVFVMQRLARCYSAVGDWEQLEAWKIREAEILKRESNDILKRQMQTHSNSKQATCLKDFEMGKVSTIEELSDWTLLDEKATTNWSCSKTIAESSNTLTNIALRVHAGDDSDDFKKNVEFCKKVAAKIIEEGLRNMPSEYLTDSILLQYSASSLANLLDHKKVDMFDLLRVNKIKNLGSNTMTQILWWSEYLAKVPDNNLSAADQVASLRLDLAKSARKEGNFKLAKRQIEKYFVNEQLLGDFDYKFCDITANILEQPININWTKNNMRAFKEMSKLLYTMDSIEDAVKVCSVTALGISRAIINDGDEINELRETGTKLMLTLGKWIQQQEINVTNNAQLNQLLQFEALHNDGLMDKLFGQTTELIPHSDMVIGKLMQLGVNQCPDFPAVWASFAGWCYKWGRKIVDNSQSGQLTEVDVSNIRALLPADITEADSNAILSILSQNKSIPEDEGDIETNDVKTSDMIENQLRQVPALVQSPNQHLGLLVDIWRQAQKRIYSYYELAANAYFKFLELTNNESNDCATITATLRLLRLIVKHALELQDVLETGLSTTPTGPWKEIIPQLFSRLSHPESYVRTRVSELLCRVAENSPHLITFPTVVGAVTDHPKDFEELPTRYENSPNDFDFDEDDGEAAIALSSVATSGETADSHNEENKTFMDACFAQLADCLSNENHDSVNHVKILVKELRRITLLWDELWLATFCQHHTEFYKKFEQLEQEVQKVLDNVWLSSDEKEKLIAEKHRIIVKPIIFVLENLLAITSAPAETPHEKLFQEKFSPCIEEVVRRLKNPKNPAKPQLSSTPLKQLEAKLAQKVNKRGNHTLSMADISPILANMKDTCIAMPGVFATDRNNKIVTIRSVDNIVQILPTKTKPKKLMFHGSDGHVYTYLFKGLEDLHLDERIMQFLSICNTMMSKNNDTRKVYRARHYSVIPLGPRSGLIQWVDGVTPLFALYKRWQQRESTMAGNRGTGNSTAVMRPSELFYNKLAPLLKEHGIPLENRKEWPLPVLKQVLSELMTETPKDLLAKEIWCNSINAGNWWQATKSYSYSVAVMSIIGYIIGLGDRHLDNVLVDLNTGEVVHIDYNVCFEKGKTLRVPEKVPFRMTPNIKTALGVTGVEGIFRLACEHTLRVMRRGRETLLTLLEAFVYDPLVDWRAGAEHSIASYGTCQARARCAGIGRKELEKELTRAMFVVRIAEMRVEWQINRDLMIRALPMLSCHLAEWLETNESLRQCQDVLQDRHQQLGLVKEAQAIGRNHSLYSVVNRYNSIKRARDAYEKAQLGLKDKMEECEKQISMHNIALATVRGPQLARWLAEYGTPSITRDDHMVFDLVKEFLQNAGQNQMILQCEQSENELTQLASQESLLIRSCLDLLSQYSAICSLYPLSTLAQHRTVAYHSFAGKLLTTRTTEICNEVMSQFEAAYQPAAVNDSRVQKIVGFSYQVQVIMNEVKERYSKYYERMVANEGLPEAQVRIDQIYADAIVQINSFLKRDKSADKALELVNITALCALNKRYLMMEGAAKCAGECLVDLTLREGEWFLDEMRLMSSLIVELTSLIPIDLRLSAVTAAANQSEDEILIARTLECLKSADAIYKGLQELNYNFHMIILPEALKTIITEEPSVMVMINEIEDIIVSSGRPLAELLSQLEIHLRCTLMDMEGPQTVVQSIVSNMRLRFEALLSRSVEINQDSSSESLTPGQMLLMGFNGLFEKLQVEGNALIATLGSLDIPTCWKKIDQIREAKEIAVPIFHEAARRVLDDIFLIKRLHTINEFFSMCREIANAFKGADGVMNIYDDDRLNKPVKIFTADFVSRQLLGVISQTLAIAICLLLQRMGLNVTGEIEQRDIGAESKVSIEELCRKMVDTSLKTGAISGTVYGQAGSLISTLESIWRRKQCSRVAQQGVEIARGTLQRLQIQFTAHHWIHEDSLLLARSNLSTINPLNRPTFMLELRKTAAALSSLQSRVCEARDQQQNLVASVDQRLKWAAGANPALAEVMAAFDNAVLSSNEKLTRQQNLALIITTTCNSILHYEALRTKTSESITHDANFIKLIKQWEESCVLRTNLAVNISTIEENLVELLQLENNIDANWLRRAEKITSDAILENQLVLKKKQESHAIAHLHLRERTADIQGLLSEHHRLMTDVRGLLKTMLKQENKSGLGEFLSEYRTFIEGISGMVKDLEADNLEPLRVIEAEGQLGTLLSKVSSVYDELLEFANESTSGAKPKFIDENIGVKKKSKLMRQDTNICFSPRKGVPLTRDPTTGKAVQERNVYALNVWRRVRMKLEGRDPNPSRKYTTAEQVEYVIREAQNFDNLALLYEGWTPWV